MTLTVNASNDGIDGGPSLTTEEKRAFLLEVMETIAKISRPAAFAVFDAAGKDMEHWKLMISGPHGAAIRRGMQQMRRNRKARGIEDDGLWGFLNELEEQEKQ